MMDEFNFNPSVIYREKRNVVTRNKPRRNKEVGKIASNNRTRMIKKIKNRNNKIKNIAVGNVPRLIRLVFR